MGFLAAPGNLAKILLPEGFAAPAVKTASKVREFPVGEADTFVFRRLDSKQP